MKKKLALTITSIALVAAVAIGGTLAWLTSQTNVLTNTFTVGDGITLTLAEPTWDANKTANPSTYNKIVAGGTIEKDPTATLAGDNAYVYMLVQNNMKIGDTTVAKFTPNDGWAAMTGITNANCTLYKYTAAGETGAATAGELPALFNEVTFDGDVITADNIADLADLDIKVVAYAYQADGGVTVAEADAAATTWANEFTNWTNAEA